MSEISKSGEDLIERQITAAQIREDNIDPVNGPLLKSVNNIRQYDFDTNKDRVFTPLGNGPGFVQIAEVEPELVTTSNIGTNISIPFPKHMDSNGLNEYYANLGKHGKKVAEEVRDTVVTGVSKGVDMFTDMASDFLGKYIQVKFDPNMFDGKSMPEINPKQILMDSVGFEGLDLSAFEPETPMGQYTSDIAAYIVAGTLTPGGSGSLASKALIKDVGALLSTGPELGNIFTAMEALGLENEIVSFFNAYMLDPDNASADERLASRIKATIDAPLFAVALFVAAKTLGKRAFKLAAGGLTGTALSAQEAEGMGSGPLGTFVKNSLKQGVKQVDNLPQPGAVNQVDNTVYEINEMGDLVPSAEGTRAHKLPHQLLVKTEGGNAELPVTQQYLPSNKQQNFTNIDLLKEKHPDALKSKESWLAMEQDALGGTDLPVPPLQAIKYAQDPNAMAEKLKQLTPELKAGVDEGFEYVKQIRRKYQDGTATPKMTADLFLWGILSRGAGPVQQEAAFLDIMQQSSDLIKKVADGKFTELDRVAWENNIKNAIVPGTPGKSVTMNVNAAGKLLQELAKVPEGTTETVLQQLHNMMSNPNISAKVIRRKFMELTDGAGIDNKVVSFTMLVSGIDDVLVMDRIQGRHFWQGVDPQKPNIYDGYKKEGTTIKEGLQGIFRGPRGLFFTEALEDGIRPNVIEAYRIAGRPEDASLGRFHWETWVIDGQQVVSHSTLKSIADNTPVGGAVTEGKFNTFGSNFKYARAEKGPIFEYPLSSGDVIYMTPESKIRFTDFLSGKLKVEGLNKNDILPTNFKVSENVERPWYENTKVNREQLDNAAKQFQDAAADGSVLPGFEGSVASSNTFGGYRNTSRRLVLDRLNSGVGDGRSSRPYQGKSLGNVEGTGGLTTFEPNPDVLARYQNGNLNIPKITQVDAKASAQSYHVEMTEAMSKHKFGAQVEIKSPEDLATYTLYRTENEGGFAIKPDGDIVAVFSGSNEPRGGIYALMQAAIEAGGRKLDAFNTMLPKIYQAVGFRPVAAVKWNDNFAPPNWNKKTFKEFNNGEPDVVLFVYDPSYNGGPVGYPKFDSFDEAAAIQDQALKDLSKDK